MALARGLLVLHPFPSLLNGILVAALAGIAGAPAVTMAVLGAAMTGLHLAIGGMNDVIDAPRDTRFKPTKPIPAGFISVRATVILTALVAAIALLLSAVHGEVALAAGVGVLAAGVVYDLWLKPTAAASLCFAVAFVLLPIFAWVPVTGALPPQAGLLLPVAALAGPVLHLSNALVDLEGDRASGSWALAVRLGQGKAVAVLAVLVVLAHGLAWWTLLSQPAPIGSIGIVAGGSVLAALGLAASANPSPRRREIGWRAQALAMVLLGAGWVLGVVSA